MDSNIHNLLKIRKEGRDAKAKENLHKAMCDLVTCIELLNGMDVDGNIYKSQILKAYNKYLDDITEC